MASIKILGGSVPKQTASYLFGILTIKDNNTKPQTYVSKEAVKHIEKVSEDKKSITFKLTLKDGTHFVGNSSRKIYDKLIVDQVLAEQSSNDKDGKIVSTVTPKAKPQPQPSKTPKPLINVENEVNSAIRAFSWIGAIILLVLCFSALDEQRNVAGAMFITASFLLMPPMKQYLSKTILDKRGWIVFLFFIIGFILMLTPQSTNQEVVKKTEQIVVNKKEIKNPQELLEDRKSEVTVFCNWIVKSSLKSPSTAKIPFSYNKISTSNDFNVYTYQSYVDAQNSFGAMLRNNFTCQVSYKTGEKELIDFKMQE